MITIPNAIPFEKSGMLLISNISIRSLPPQASLILLLALR
jgi:hypothetical protein